MHSFFPNNLNERSSIAEMSARRTTANRRRICIVTSAPICCNPRVVKEADALSSAGFSTRVVASQHAGWVADWDRSLMIGRAWELDPIRWDDFNSETKSVRLRSGLRQRAFNVLASGFNRGLIPERAYSRLFHEQLRSAIAVGAEIYLAHNPQALPVAAAAANYHGVQFAFDSEDYHSGEVSADERASRQYQLLTTLERKYLPQCAYVSVPSIPIAEALRDRYGIRKPTAIHNVFCWSDRERVDGKVKDRRGEALSLYWHSQIIGLDRGLQDVIRAAALLSAPVQIHLRGAVSTEVKNSLLQLASSHSVVDRLLFHEPVRPEELLSRTMEHDVGLALEHPLNDNKNFTVSNKFFQYLLGGLSLAATDTIGQSNIMSTCLTAGFLYQPGDYKALAENLRRLIDEPRLLIQRKRAALEAARGRWNWENESHNFIELVQTTLGKTALSSEIDGEQYKR